MGVDRTITYSPPMVRARLAGLKTQTRRLATAMELEGTPLEHHLLQDWVPVRAGGMHGTGGLVATHALPVHARRPPDTGALRNVYSGRVLWCPYGGTGDGLIVREAYRTLATYDGAKPRDLPRSLSPGTSLWYDADGAPPAGFGRYRHARFMMMWMSRGRDEVLHTSAQRLSDITEQDAIAEGIVPLVGADGRIVSFDGGAGAAPTAVQAYRLLWESLHGQGSWGRDPWVWRVVFRVGAAVPGVDTGSASAAPHQWAAPTPN